MVNKFLQIDFRFLFLAAMLVSLPGLEAFKNIFAFLFVISWFLNSKNNRSWGGNWQIIDSIFFLWLLADILISVNSIFTHNLPGSGYTDTLRFVLIAWVISRTFFSQKDLSKLALLAIVGTIMTLAYSYYSTNGVLKELHSVGHINHTAIFLLIAYSISLSLFLLNFKNLTIVQKSLLCLSIIILFIATIDTASRAAFAMLFIITLMNFIYLLIKLRKISLVLLFFGLFAVVVITLLQNPPHALQRIHKTENIFKDSTREKIHNFSYYAFKENPFLGIGFGNYHQLKVKDIEDSIIKNKGVFDQSQYQIAPHAHNVYFNYLVSGGILIFSIFLWFWFYIVWIIAKLIVRSKTNEWIILSSLSVVFINLIIGWFNTTFHHEHAILSMFILGILISKYRLIQQSDNFQRN
jgi:O-antigen ligase